MAALEGDSNDIKVPAVKGVHSAGGVALLALSQQGEAVRGETSGQVAAVVGHNHGDGAGMWAEADGKGVGLFAKGKQGEGVRAETSGQVAAVVGHNHGDGAGMWAEADGKGMGIFAKSKQGEGVHAETTSTSAAAGAFFQMNASSDTAALYAKHAGNRTAAVFEGNVIVTADITLANADCAEEFDICKGENVEAGMVVVLGHDGALMPSTRAYDRRVAGVISGAGSYKPGLVLDKHDKSENSSLRMPVALLGKVYCMVDARFGAIGIGDLLTTSPTPGHAMKASDPSRAFGAVIGKALRPLAEGQELLPILIALQ